MSHMTPDPSKNGSAGVPVAPADPRIRRVLVALHNKYLSPLSPEQIASSLNLSQSRLAHLFRQQVGTSLTRYVRRLRLVEARKLIETTTERIQQIEVRCGFNHSGRFASDFK